MSVKSVKISDLPPAFQYVHYVFTACRLVSFGGWHAEGRPNPFVARRVRQPKTIICAADLKTFRQEVQPAPLKEAPSNVVWLMAA